MGQIPDAPWIREAEMNGVDYEPQPKCPVCGEECETIYLDREGDPCGCEWCTSKVDSWEWYDEHRD